MNRLLSIAAILLLYTQEIAAFSSNEEIFKRGVEALSHSDFVIAEQSFQAVLQSEPNNLAALGNLGVVYSRTNRPGPAIGAYKQALTIAPHEPSLLLNLGLAYLKQEDYTQALPNFLEAERLSPQSRQAKELIATCQIFTGAAQAAILRLEALRTSDANRAGVLYLLGVAYTRNREPDKAKTVWAELLGSSATREESALLLGRAYYDGGQFENAEQSYRQALSSKDSSREARLGLAKTLISERKNSEAITELEHLLTQNTADPDAHYYLGALLLQSDRFAEALPHLEFADKAIPNSAAVSFYLGRTALAQRRYPAAVTYLKRATELNGENDSAYYAFAQALRASGRADEAKTALEHVRSAKARSLGQEQTALGHIPPAQ